MGMNSPVSLLTGLLFLAPLAARAALTFNGAIEFGSSTYEAGGDMINFRATTLDYFSFPATYGMTITATVTSSHSDRPALALYRGFPPSGAEHVAAMIGVPGGQQFTFTLPAFDPSPDADPFPATWTFMAFTESQPSGLVGLNPVNFSSLFPNAAYQIVFEGVDNIEVREGVITLADSTSAPALSFRTTALSTVPEPGIASMAALAGLMLRGRRRKEHASTGNYARR